MANRKTLAGVIGAAAAGVLIAFSGGNEGTRNVPYQDIGGVWTVCDGQTRVQMRYYTDAECNAMLGDTLAQDAVQIQAMTPGFDTLPDGVKVATIDFGYNVGLGAYQRSSLRTKLIARDLPQACDVFLLYKFAGGKDCSQKGSGCPGVWNRRLAERQMCLSGK